MTRRWFGTDGIRGPVGRLPMTPEFVLRLGQAAGKVLMASQAEIGSTRNGRKPVVLIGKDTRLSGYMLEAALEAGLSSMGVDVRLVGPLPTPGVAYLTRALRLDAGIVISASHNPFEDNGIKFFSGQGSKLSDAIEARIEAYLESDAMTHPALGCVAAAEMGRARRIDDAAGRYIEFCKSSFPQRFDLRGMKIVVDAAHGAAYHIAAPVLHELGAQVVRIGHEPDGTNINQACGATHPQTMRDKVLESGADLGMALDGDADRVIMCDSAGRIYGGDELLWIIVNHRARLQPVPGVVGTLMSNFALEQGFLKHGIAFERAKVGDRYVLERLQNRGWLLGGEGSGHLLALDLHSTGDGIISGLQVLAAVVDSGKQLAELCSDLSLMPQVLINVPKPEGFELQADQAFKAVCAAVDEELAGHGRSLVRPSGTEPVIRVMVEHPDYAKAQAYAEQIASSISPGGRPASAHQAG
ncbi:MAG: phosphoglucosamine mutase [Betaproteobacteria bacterium]|nr:phosphoglucosamine mutase [Betaproteobacteria bacterium]